jgi:hypothetical protein
MAEEADRLTTIIRRPSLQTIQILFYQPPKSRRIPLKGSPMFKNQRTSPTQSSGTNSVDKTSCT